MVEREYENEPVFDDEITTALDDGAAPAAVNAQVSAILNDGTTVAQPPELHLPPDTYVRLPGGLGDPENPIRDAEVRELNGDDEEALAKSLGSSDPLRYFKTLLDRGVVSVGDQPATPHLLRELLLGDREALILGVRRATFGNEVTIEDFYCKACNETMDVTVLLDSIPVKDLEDSREFDVPLRKGGTAHVHLPTGHDQETVMSHESLTPAEQNTILLSRCVDYVVGPTGKKTPIGNSTAQVNLLGVADRRKILDELAERQPGPRYDEITMLHEPCGTELPVTLTVVAMFRGL